MRQRVALAQALIMKPKIVLLDEPFGALDESMREELQIMLLRLYQENLLAKKAGKTPEYTILLVTHELNEAIYVSDRVIGMSRYHTEGHLGSSIVYDRPSPIFHPDDPRDFSLFIEQREELRRAVFDPEYIKDRNKYVTFWNEVANMANEFLLASPGMKSDTPAIEVRQETTNAPQKSLRFSSSCQTIVLIGLVVVAYFQVSHAGFIWDDDKHFTQNPCIVGPRGFWDIWTTDQARICPLTLTVFLAPVSSLGVESIPFPLAERRSLRCFGCPVLEGLATIKDSCAFLAAAIWAVHPVQVETVAWVTELKNTQSGLFYLLSGYFYLCFYTDQNGRGWKYFLAMLCGILAMASKSSTVILPVIW